MVLDPRLAQKPSPQFLWSSLTLISESFSLRCDAKQAEERFRVFDDFISSVQSFELGDFFPGPFLKGGQPSYLEEPDAEGIPVVSTIV